MRARGNIILAFVVGLLVGGIVGVKTQRAAFHRFWKHGPDSGRIMNKLTRELKLDPKQHESVRAIVEKRREKMMSLHKEIREKIAAVRMEMRSDVKKLLNPQQQQKFEALQARWDAHHKEILTGK